LTSIGDLAVAPDGFVYVVDSRSSGIRVYNPQGRLVSQFGREGEGPGEFSPAIYIVGAHSDSVLVYDENRGGILTFRRNGTFVRAQRLERVPQDRILAGYLSGGRALVRIDYFPTERGRWMDSIAYRITDSTARVLETIAVYPAPPRMPGIRVGNGGFALQQPFAAEAHAAQHPGGNRAVVVLPSQFWRGRPGEVKLVYLTPAGIEVERVVNLGARRLTEAQREEWIRKRVDPLAARLEQAGTPRAGVERSLRDAIVMPQYLPDVVEASYGADGSVWLKRYDSDEWVVVGPSGSVAFRVSVPAGVRVREVSLVSMWGVTSDADGVPVITRYRVSGA
jgi:hypothetical protein